MIHPDEIEHIGFSALFHLCRANIRKSEADINCFVLIFLSDKREIQGIAPFALLGDCRWRQCSYSLCFYAAASIRDIYRRIEMLETIAIILIILWLLGLVSSYTMGGFIHVLLVIAVVVIILRVIQGQRPV